MQDDKNIKLIKKFIEEDPGFIKFNNFILEEVDSKHVKLSVDITNNSLNPSGFVHGGLLFTLADSAMGMLARTTGSNAVTVNAQIDYLKPGQGNKIFAIAEPVRIGNKIAVYKTSIINEQNELISIVNGTYYFVKYPEAKSSQK